LDRNTWTGTLGQEHLDRNTWTGTLGQEHLDRNMVRWPVFYDFGTWSCVLRSLALLMGMMGYFLR
jgi:hypothetical protein